MYVVPDKFDDFHVAIHIIGLLELGQHLKCLVVGALQLCCFLGQLDTFGHSVSCYIKVELDFYLPIVEGSASKDTLSFLELGDLVMAFGSDSLHYMLSHLCVEDFLTADCLEVV